MTKLFAALAIFVLVLMTYRRKKTLWWLESTLEKS